MAVKRSLVFAIALLTVALAAVGCSSSSEGRAAYSGAGKPLVDVIAGSANFSAVKDGKLPVDLYPIYTRPQSMEPSGRGDHVLELRGSRGAVVDSIPFYAPRLHADPTGETLPAYFAIEVPHKPDFTSFAIMKDGQELFVQQRSPKAPAISLSGVTAGQVFSNGDYINLFYPGKDADGDMLTYQVYHSADGGSSYVRLGDATRVAAQAVVAERLRISGLARLAVAVSDGTRSAFAETPVFGVGGRAPEVSIKTPAGQRFAAERFQLDAIGYDQDEGLLDFDAYSWHSSLDGDLGTGSYIWVATEDLTEGEHVITVTASDRAGLTATDAITIVVSH